MAKTGVCTENSILIDYVIESRNVSGDDALSQFEVENYNYAIYSAFEREAILPAAKGC